MLAGKAESIEEMKDFLYQHNQTIQQHQQQLAAQEAQAKEAEMKKAQGDMDLQELEKKGKQLENDEKLQSLAFNEAQQTTPNFESDVRQMIGA